MFKVSFKGNFKDVQTFNDKATVVTLTGRVQMPDWWHKVPREIYEWTDNHPSVSVDECYGTLEIILVAQGKSKCHDDDSFDSVIGERIAESKAKIKIYKFMHTLCHKLYTYYFGLALGDRYAICPEESIDMSKSGGIFEAMGKYQGLLIKESHHLGELLKET